MKKLKTRDQVLKELNIPDFRHLNVRSLMKFVSAYDRMDPEVAKAAIAQFPNFSEAVKSVMTEYKAIIDKGIEANTLGSQKTLEFFNDRAVALEDLLKDKDLSSDERVAIIGLLNKLSDKVENLDKRNKNFLLKLAGVVSLAAAIGVGALLAGQGGGAAIQTQNSDEDDENLES